MPGAPQVLSEVTVGGYTADIVAENYRYGESLAHGPWREVVYQIPADDAPFFIDALMGLVRPKGGGGASYQLPHGFPNNEVIRCVEAHAEPVGVPRPGVFLFSSDYAHVVARYEVLRGIDFGGDQYEHAPAAKAVPWTSWRIHGKTRVVPVPRDALVKEGAADAPEKDQPRRLHVEEMELTYHYMPYLPLAALRSVAKCVNASPMLDLDTGQVLFDEYECTREVSSDGSIVQTVRVVLLGQSVDWNKVPQDDDMDFVKVLGAGNGLPMYPYADLTPLLALNA